MQANKTKLSNQYILTADIGGSHITTGICNLKTNTIIPTSLFRTEVMSKGSASMILDSWAKTLKRSAASCPFQVAGLGLAMPGPFDYERGISYIKGLSKYEALYGMNIKEYLADLMQLHPSLIRFRNDAEATIDGEVLAGAGVGYKNVMGVTLGTGFGSAHFMESVTKDINLGSEPFLNSIADDHLTTRWFTKRYHELTGISVAGVKELVATAGKEELVKKIFKEFASNMCDFLSGYIRQHTPEALILCGNISRSSGLFLPALRKKLNPLVIKIAQKGEEAALIGAAGLFEYTDTPVTIFAAI